MTLTLHPISLIVSIEMSYKTSHSLFELICSKLFATTVLSGIVLASTISAANSILTAPSHVSPTSTLLNPISKPGPTKGVDTEGAEIERE